MRSVSLASVCSELESGSRPKESKGLESGVPSLGGEHIIHGGSFNFEKMRFIPEDYYRSMRSGRIKPNDILVVKDGATTGKTSFAGSGFPYQQAAVNEHVFRVGVDQAAAFPRYIFHFLVSEWGQREILKDFRGATVGGIGRSFIETAMIPLPPLPEQKRIAEILDQADTLRRLHNYTLGKLNALGHVIFYEMFGDPVLNPKKYKVRSLADVCTFLSGATPSKGNEAFWDGDIPWVSPKDMKTAEISEAQDHVSELAFSSSTLKRIPASACLIVVRGMILAHTVPIAITRIQCAINQDMKAIIFGDEILPEFGVTCLQAQAANILKRVDSAAHGTKRLDMDELSAAPILIPPRSEQERFVAMLANIRENCAQAARGLAGAQSLFASLQHRAFRGEL